MGEAEARLVEADTQADWQRVAALSNPGGECRQGFGVRREDRPGIAGTRRPLLNRRANRARIAAARERAAHPAQAVEVAQERMDRRRVAPCAGAQTRRERELVVPAGEVQNDVEVRGER